MEDALNCKDLKLEVEKIRSHFETTVMGVQAEHERLEYTIDAINHRITHSDSFSANLKQKVEEHHHKSDKGLSDIKVEKYSTVQYVVSYYRQGPGI